MVRLAVCVFALLACVWGDASAWAEEWKGGPGYETTVVGDENAPRPHQIRGGFLLSGGGDWDRAAFRWFADRAGNGHIVVLSASPSTDGHIEFYERIGGLASVRLFLFRDRRAAFDEKLLEAVRRADGIFLGGGDQANYVRMWRNTPLSRIMDEAVAAGEPIGGTSAGLAVQGAWLYGAMDGGSITSEEALRDPLGPGVTMVDDFLHTRQLAHIVTDSHFDARDRLGRLIAFLVKARTLAPRRRLVGLGIDEAASMVVETNGEAHLFGQTNDNHAWLVSGGEVSGLAPGAPLNARGISVVGISPLSRFNVLTLEVENPGFERIYDVEDGVLIERPADAGD